MIDRSDISDLIYISNTNSGKNICSLLDRKNPIIMTHNGNNTTNVSKQSELIEENF